MCQAGGDEDNVSKAFMSCFGPTRARNRMSNTRGHVKHWKKPLRRNSTDSAQLTNAQWLLALQRGNTATQPDLLEDLLGFRASPHLLAHVGLTWPTENLHAKYD